MRTQACIVVAGHDGFAGVEFLPHPHRALRKRPLRILGCGDSVRCSGKGDEEPIALRSNFDAAMARDRLSQYPAVFCE